MKGVRRPSPALVIACAALFVALGGTSYAVIKLPAGSVGTKQLKRNAVTSPKVKNNAITGADVKEPTLGVVPNADKLDGLDASAFAAAGHEHSGVILHSEHPSQFVLATSGSATTTEIGYFTYKTRVSRGSAGGAVVNLGGSVPAALYGRAVRATGAEYCADTRQANSYVTIAALQVFRHSAGVAEVVGVSEGDITDRDGESSCYALAFSSPPVLSGDDTLNLYVDLVFTGSSYIDLGRVTFVLEPTATTAAP